MDWLKDNKSWLFGGVLASIISVVATVILSNGGSTPNTHIETTQVIEASGTGVQHTGSGDINYTKQ